MTRTILAGSIAALLAITPLQAQKPEAAETLLQSSIKKEIVDGNLTGAIDGYKKALAAAKDNRAVAAQALLHMADCYQKLGDSQAIKIFEQLVREYADQRDVVAMARARLGGSTAGNEGVVSRQMWSGPKVDAYGGVSPDSRFLSFTDWDTGDLAIHDFTTGQDRRLTNKGTWNDSVEQALMSSVSRDGKQVAYGWLVAESYELRTIDFNGGKPRVLAARPDAGFQPLDWSPDGKWIAVQVERRNRTGEVGIVATADGTFRPLKSVGRPAFPLSRMTFSPDSKYLACDLPVSDNSDRHEIHLLSVDGGVDTPGLAQSANDRVLGWSADGRMLFTSERTGLTGIWSQLIRDGKPQGAPELVKANVNPYPIGLTRTGALYYSVVSSVPTIYLASVDFDTDKVLSGPSPMPQPYFGLSNFPQWSRDGKYLAYLSKRDANSRNGQLNILAIRAIDTGEVRELHPDLLMLNVGTLAYPLWTPDGAALIVSATDKQGGQGIYRVDARSGATTPLVMRAATESRAIIARGVAPDGKTIYIEKRDSPSNTAAIFAHDLSSGQERELLRRDALSMASLSPDGRSLAVLAVERSTHSSALMTMPVDGGRPRELLRTSNLGSDSLGAFVAWLPDGKSILFRKGPVVSRETFRIPADGGTAVKYGAAWSLGQPVMNPNGRDVAFPMGQHTIEIWAMDNFLPKAAAAR